MKSKGSRFLIDKIDSKLGSVEKELKFDKAVIFVGVGIVVISAFVLGIFINSHPVLALLSTMALMFGFFLSYTMVKEFLSDLKRYQSQYKKKDEIN